MGRNRKPIESKKLSGTLRKDRTRKRVPVRPQDVRPPASLSEDARAVWDQLAPELVRIGVLTPLDVSMFAIYVDAIARWTKLTAAIDAAEMVTETGDRGHRQQVAEISLAMKYAGIAQKIGRRFGLDPVSRLGLEILPGNIAPNDERPKDEDLVSKRLRLL